MVTTTGRRPPDGGGMRASGPTPGLFAPPESARPTIVGERWVVSAGHPLVAQAAAAVFEAGGSAVDAGVAGALTATVAQVDMCNLGGVAPALVRAAGDDVVHATAGVGPWGAATTLDAFRARFGDDMP